MSSSNFINQYRVECLYKQLYGIWKDEMEAKDEAAVARGYLKYNHEKGLISDEEREERAAEIESKLEAFKLDIQNSGKELLKEYGIVRPHDTDDVLLDHETLIAADYLIKRNGMFIDDECGKCNEIVEKREMSAVPDAEETKKEMDTASGEQDVEEKKPSIDTTDTGSKLNTVLSDFFKLCTEVWIALNLVDGTNEEKETRFKDCITRAVCKAIERQDCDEKQDENAIDDEPQRRVVTRRNKTREEMERNEQEAELVRNMWRAHLSEE